MADESKGDSPYADAPTDLLDQTEPDPEDTLGGRTGDAEPPHPGLIRHILTSLRPGQDLTRVTIPSFFLEDRSLLEKLTDTMMHPDLILKCVAPDWAAAAFVVLTCPTNSGCRRSQSPHAGGSAQPYAADGAVVLVWLALQDHCTHWRRGGGGVSRAQGWALTRLRFCVRCVHRA